MTRGASAGDSKRPSGCPEYDHQRLAPGHLPQVEFDQVVLHPVLEDLAALAVGDQLIGIKGHVEVQVVVDHHLERLGFQDPAGIFPDRPGLQAALGPIAVPVNPPAGQQLVHELRGDLLVQPGGDITQGVFKGDFGLGGAQVKTPVRGAADARDEALFGGQFVGQGERPGRSCFLCHGGDTSGNFICHPRQVVKPRPRGRSAPAGLTKRL